MNEVMKADAEIKEKQAVLTSSDYNDDAQGGLHQKEDRYALDEKIKTLKEDIEIRLEKVVAAENSKKAYGDAGFSTLVGGLESTDELIQREKKELEILEHQRVLFKSKHKSLLHSLKNFFN